MSPVPDMQARLALHASRFTRLMAPLAISAVLFGCGYQFRVEGPGPVIGGSSDAARTGPVPRMTIVDFENHTFEPNLEQRFTQYARHEFETGGVDVVNDRTRADYLLKSQIISVTAPSLSFNQTTTFEQRVIVTVKATVTDLRQSKDVWTQHSTGASEFFLTNDLQFNRVLQNRALEQAGKQIAEDLAARFMAYLNGEGGGAAKAPAKSDVLPPPIKPPAGSR
jgi:outer membrane lipopolysaccharide assembly protein LptE/RlpB